MTVIGTLDIRDFDLGCMLTIGAEIVYYTIDGSLRAQYVVDVSGLNTDIERFQNKVPVFFDSPDDEFQDFIVPSFVFKSNSMNDAFDRQPYAGTVGRSPAKDAIPIYGDNGTIAGYSKYEEQVRPDPYDLSFDLIIYAERKQEVNKMMAHVMKKMRPPWFNFKVIDSLGDIREYDTGDMSYSNASELADIADRTAAWTLSFTVRGEIDTFDGICSPAMIDPYSSVQLGVPVSVMED
jgi:hypothetical protein